MLRFLRSPLIYFILTDVLAFMLLFRSNWPLDWKVLVTGGIVLILTLFTYLVIHYLFHGDSYIFLISSMLVILGIVMIYRLDPSYGIKQVGWYVIGILAFIVSFLAIRYLNFWKYVKWIYFIAVLFK